LPDFVLSKRQGEGVVLIGAAGINALSERGETRVKLRIFLTFMSGRNYGNYD
jgi:hypothetical protein